MHKKKLAELKFWGQSKSESEHIAIAFELGRSRYIEGGRGNGLYKMKEMARKKRIGIRIVSGRGCAIYDIEQDAFITMKDEDVPFSGTLIELSMEVQRDGKND